MLNNKIKLLQQTKNIKWKMKIIINNNNKKINNNRKPIKLK